jgi:protein phosphatase
VRPEEIANILGRESDPRRAAQLLVDAANAAGGEDNITAVIVAAVEIPGDDAAVAPIVDDGDDATDTGGRPPKRRRRRARTLLRVAIWALPILLVLAVAFAFVGWYARNTFYVGVDRGRVTVFQGVKGGLLIWDPTIERRTDLDPDELTQAQRQDVDDGKKFSSRSGADEYVRRLRQGVVQRATAATTTVPAPPAGPPAAPPPS